MRRESANNHTIEVLVIISILPAYRCIVTAVCRQKSERLGRGAARIGISNACHRLPGVGSPLVYTFRKRTENRHRALSTAACAISTL